MRLVIAFAIALIVVSVGFPIIRMLGQPVPEPPAPGEMRKINLRFRCSICSAELKMVLAADEMPEPPRHCQEDMQLVAPALE